MQVKKTDTSPTISTLEIVALEEDLAPIKRHVLGHFNKVKVPGFRPGKAPLHLIEKHVDRNALIDEFLEHAINDLFKTAANESSLRPVSQPNFQLKNFVPFTNLSFEVTVETIGKVSIPDYKKMKLPPPPKVSVAAKDVSDVIKSLQNRMAERKEVDRAAKTGDEAVIDFEGTDKDGQKVPGADGKEYPLLLGSGTFIPGFEDHVTGLKAGDEKTFDITFPKDYGAKSLQNKKLTFKVTVKKVNELIEPKLDDDFATKVGPFKSVDELKKDIKKQLTAERQNQAYTDYENQLLKEIIAKTEIEIPESLIKEQLDRMEQSEKQNLMYKGQTWKEHLEEEGVSEEEHRARQRPDAIERLKGGLVLGEIAERENIQVSQEELDARIQLLRGQYQDPKMQAELDKPENRRDIENRLITEKTIAALVKYAKE